MKNTIDIMVSTFSALFVSVLILVVLYFCGFTTEWKVTKQFAAIGILFLCNFLYLRILISIGRSIINQE